MFAVIPEYGSVRLPLSELLAMKVARVLLLRGVEIQRRKLGLSWFFLKFVNIAAA